MSIGTTVYEYYIIIIISHKKLDSQRNWDSKTSDVSTNKLWYLKKIIILSRGIFVPQMCFKIVQPHSCELSIFTKLKVLPT